MAATIRTDKIGPVSGSADFTLPTSDGSAKSALITDGSKVLSFATGTPSASNFLRGDGTWAAPAGGLTAASQWRLTTDFTGAAAPIASNLEEVDAPVGFGVLGSSMTESSGIFTFPSTGYWLITCGGAWYTTANSSYLRIFIYTTTDDSTYASSSEGVARPAPGSNVTYNGATCSYIMDVVSTSLCKCRFDISIQTGTVTTRGDTDVNRTYMSFLRLADT